MKTSAKTHEDRLKRFQRRMAEQQETSYDRELATMPPGCILDGKTRTGGRHYLIPGKVNREMKAQQLVSGRAKFAMYQATKDTPAPVFPTPKQQGGKSFRLAHLLPAFMTRMFNRKVGG